MNALLGCMVVTNLVAGTADTTSSFLARNGIEVGFKLSQSNYQTYFSRSPVILGGVFVKKRINNYSLRFAYERKGIDSYSVQSEKLNKDFSSSSYLISGGVQKTFFSKNKFSVYGGTDFVFYHEHFATQSYVTNHTSLGIKPFLGVQYDISQKLYFSAEIGKNLNFNRTKEVGFYNSQQTYNFNGIGARPSLDFSIGYKF